AEDLARLDGADRLPLGGERDHAFDQEVHLVALQQKPARLLVLREEHRPGRYRFLLARRFEEGARCRRHVERRGGRGRLRRSAGGLAEVEVIGHGPDDTYWCELRFRSSRMATESIARSGVSAARSSPSTWRTRS